MAVNIVKERNGIKGTNVIEHHRNPSGQNNKVKWLLKQSHRDINKIHEIVSNIVMSGYDMISSWLVAEMMAVDIVKYDFKDRHEYVIALREGKIYQNTTAAQDNAIEIKLTDKSSVECDKSNSPIDLIMSFIKTDIGPNNIECGEECDYEPLEIPLKTICEMVENGTWEGSLEQEEIEYNVEHKLYPVKQLKQYSEILAKIKEDKYVND